MASPSTNYRVADNPPAHAKPQQAQPPQGRPQ
jgi:hypothetical protein